jgi:hypothetical protein
MPFYKGFSLSPFYALYIGKGSPFFAFAHHRSNQVTYRRLSHYRAVSSDTPDTVPNFQLKQRALPHTFSAIFLLKHSFILMAFELCPPLPITVIIHRFIA